MIRLVLALLAVIVRPVAAQPARTAQSDTGRFETEIRAFEARDRQGAPPSGAVLFVGSSTIRMWCTLDRDFPELKTINRGFGGSEMSDLLFYAGRVVLPYRPRTIVLYEGDNDLAAGKTPAQVQDAFRRFTALVRQRLPDARLVVVSIKPSVAREKLLDETRAANALLVADARRDPQHVTYVDLFTPMLGRDGKPRRELFGGDGLHMNSAGYALWRATLQPVLDAR